MRKGSADQKLSLRVTADVLKRADMLRTRIAKNPNVVPLGRVTQSTVLKLALLRGLDALEAEYR
jgi:hypothetical protein